MKTTAIDQSGQYKIDGASDLIARGDVPAWKFVLDCALVALTAPVWLPLCVLIALWVKLASPGPILFRQERIGHMGVRFLCVKFRTMKVNSNTALHRELLGQLITSNLPMKKLDTTGDSRLIPGGLLLRTLGLDELPQIINIIRGEMSLVGPRPTTTYEYKLFLPEHRRRCQTLPGLTGLWQVNGKNRTTFQRMMELDLQYVERKSLWLDLRILARTPIAILLQCWDVVTRMRTAPPGNREISLPVDEPRNLVSGNSGLTTRTAPPSAPRLAVLPLAPGPADVMAVASFAAHSPMTEPPDRKSVV